MIQLEVRYGSGEPNGCAVLADARVALGGSP